MRENLKLRTTNWLFHCMYDAVSKFIRHLPWSESVIWVIERVLNLELRSWSGQCHWCIAFHDAPNSAVFSPALKTPSVLFYTHCFAAYICVEQLVIIFWEVSFLFLSLKVSNVFCQHAFHFYFYVVIGSQMLLCLFLMLKQYLMGLSLKLMRMLTQLWNLRWKKGHWLVEIRGK